MSAEPLPKIQNSGTENTTSPALQVLLSSTSCHMSFQIAVSFSFQAAGRGLLQSTGITEGTKRKTLRILPIAVEKTSYDEKHSNPTATTLSVSLRNRAIPEENKKPCMTIRESRMNMTKATIRSAAAATEKTSTSERRNPRPRGLQFDERKINQLPVQKAMAKEPSQTRNRQPCK